MFTSFLSGAVATKLGEPEYNLEFQVSVLNRQIIGTFFEVLPRNALKQHYFWQKGHIFVKHDKGQRPTTGH